MARIIPFKGTLYNPDQIKDISKVVAPPYDVISPHEQDQLYNDGPHNIIHILLGKDFPNDDEKENRYTRAAKFLKDWQEEDILKKDKEESIYIYMQEFKVNGKLKRRLGFISLLRLEEFDTKRSSVYPHENTLSAPKEDRFKLISSIETNLGPIFVVFEDDDKTIEDILMTETRSTPMIDITDNHGIKNKLWHVSDKATVESVVRLMKDKKIFIADGHHRYEVGLAFSKIKKTPRYRYILSYFTNIDSDGIVILPVHRLIAGLDNDDVAGFEKQLEKQFKVEELTSKEKINEFLSGTGGSKKRFVVYNGHRFIGLNIDHRDSLDVTILHDLIIGPLQEKLEAAGHRKLSIDFTKDLDYAIDVVDKKRFSVSIMLNPTKVTQVRDIAFSGKRMPQKSTYFYPKVLTGLVINVF